MSRQPVIDSDRRNSNLRSYLRLRIPSFRCQPFQFCSQSLKLLLGEALPEGFSAKDAFDHLDLTKSGFRVLFDAKWIWFEPSPVVRPESRSSSWSQVETERELIRWEAAWAASGSPADSPVFLPTLLTDASLAFFRAQRDRQIVAGCIANRSRAGVVGFSNFFAPDSGRDRYRSRCSRRQFREG
jgi:hypothetical protein